MDASSSSNSTPPKEVIEALDHLDYPTSSDDDIITISTDYSSTPKNTLNTKPPIDDEAAQRTLRLFAEACDRFTTRSKDFDNPPPDNQLKVNEWINKLSFNDAESNSNSSKLNYYSLENDENSVGKDKADVPLSPETQKKNELCLYLQLMDMNATDKKIVNSMQNRRSTRVKNLKIMLEKRSLEQKLLSEFRDKESLAKKSFNELEMTVQDPFDITEEKTKIFNLEFLPKKILEDVVFFDDSVMSVVGKEIRRKLRKERRNGVKNNDKENKKLLVAKLKKKFEERKTSKPELRMIKAKLRKQNMLRTTKNLRSTKALRSSLNLNHVGIKSLTLNERSVSKKLIKNKTKKKLRRIEAKPVKKPTQKPLKKTSQPIRNSRRTKEISTKEKHNSSKERDTSKKKSKATRLLEVKQRNEKRRLLDERKTSSDDSDGPTKRDSPVREIGPPGKDGDTYENYVPKKKRMSLLMSMTKKPKFPEKLQPAEEKDVRMIEGQRKKEEFNGTRKVREPEKNIPEEKPPDDASKKQDSNKKIDNNNKKQDSNNKKPDSNNKKQDNNNKKQDNNDKKDGNAQNLDDTIISPKENNARVAEILPRITTTAGTLKPASTKPEFSMKCKTQSEVKTSKDDQEYQGTRAVHLLNMIKCSRGTNEATIKEKIHFTNTADIFYKSTRNSSSPACGKEGKIETTVSKGADNIKLGASNTFNVIDLSKNAQYNAWQEHNYTKNSDKDKEYIMKVILGNVSGDSSSSSEDEDGEDSGATAGVKSGANPEARPETPEEDYKVISKPNVELPKEIFEEPKTPTTPKLEKTNQKLDKNTPTLEKTTPKHKRTLHRLLIQKNRGSFDSMEFGNDAWSSEQSLANTINISRANGKILKAVYLGFNLVIVQEQLVSFWAQSPLGNMLGVQRFWVAKGSVQRLLLDSTYICKESRDVVVNLDKSFAYIELWMKEHKSDKRERPVADIFATVYFWTAVNGTQSSKKALQLENIKGDIKDVQYVVIRTARKIVVSWMEMQDTEAKTIIHCYTLSPDYQSIINVLTMSPLDHYVQSLHTIGECADAVVGFGEKYITIWGLEYGEIFETIEIDPRYREPRIMWLEKDRGLLFFIQYHRIERLLMLVAVNGYSKESKKMQVFRVPSGYDSINGVCVDNNMLAALFDNGVLCWDIKTGYAVIEELCSEDQLIASNKHVIAVKSNIIEVVHFQSYFLTNFDLQA